MCSTCNCKRWTTNFTVACFFLAGGVEYSVILPTMFDYLTKHFDGKEWLYGLCLSAFSISNLFMGPLFGFVFDWTHRTKLIVLFANLFEIGGILLIWHSSLYHAQSGGSVNETSCSTQRALEHRGVL